MTDSVLETKSCHRALESEPKTESWFQYQATHKCCLFACILFYFLVLVLLLLVTLLKMKSLADDGDMGESLVTSI